MGGVARDNVNNCIHHISYKDETWHSYTLPNEDPKNA